MIVNGEIEMTGMSGMMQGMHGMGGMFGNMHWWAWLAMLSGWFVLLGGLLVLTRVLWPACGGNEGARREGPMDILRQRYARGEISREEYLRMCEDLHR